MVGSVWLREGAAPLLTERATWLAGFREDWLEATAFAVPSGSTWAHARALRRRGRLAQLRRVDPAAARQLLDDAWADLPGDERAPLVEVLERGLGPDDELLLARAQGDARRDVRMAAAALLARLPGSAYAGRMARRAG